MTIAKMMMIVKTKMKMISKPLMTRARIKVLKSLMNLMTTFILRGWSIFSEIRNTEGRVNIIIWSKRIEGIPF